MASGSRKLSAVELLEQFETYAYVGQFKQSWEVCMKAYKQLKEKLANLIRNTGKIDELAAWRNNFRVQNTVFDERMGSVQYEQWKRDGGLYSKPVDDPQNNLRTFVKNATQECEKLVQVLETQRRKQETPEERKIRMQEKLKQKQERNPENYPVLLENNAQLRLMRAYTDAF